MTINYLDALGYNNYSFCYTGSLELTNQKTFRHKAPLGVTHKVN